MASERDPNTALLWVGVGVAAVGAALAAVFIGKDFFDDPPPPPETQDECAVFFAAVVEKKVDVKNATKGQLKEFITRTAESNETTNIKQTRQSNELSELCGRYCTMMNGADSPASRTKFEDQLLACMGKQLDQLVPGKPPSGGREAAAPDAAGSPPPRPPKPAGGAAPRPTVGACAVAPRTRSLANLVRTEMGKCIAEDERNTPAWSVTLFIEPPAAPKIEALDDEKRAECRSALEPRLGNQKTTDLPSPCKLTVEPSR